MEIETSAHTYTINSNLFIFRRLIFRRIIFSLLLLFSFFPIGCRLFSPSGSSALPQVKIVNPLSGDTVGTAQVTICVEVTSREDILKVRFFDNNLFLGEVYESPYEHMWETAFVSNGRHELSAEAIDVSGNSGNSPNVSVYVSKEDMFDWMLIDSPTAQDLHALFAVDSNTIWACGNNGTILVYDGLAWNTVSISLNVDLLDLFFISPEKGWCIGENTILVFEQDAWSTLLSFSKKKLCSLFLFSDSVGWMGDSDGRIYYFDGDTITEYSVLDTVAVTDIVGFSPSDMWASCGSSLFHFDGANWEHDTTFTGEQVNALSSPDAFRIWGTGSKLFYYNGNFWNLEDLPKQNGNAMDVFFLNSNNGIICGVYEGKGFIVCYDGITWVEESIQRNVVLNSITGFTNGTAWAVGNQGTILCSEYERGRK